MINKENLLFILIFLSIASTTLGQTFWITSTADSGPGTVRQAITDLNNSLDASNVIKVSLAGNVEVVLESNLPAIENSVIFDGQDVLSPSQLMLNGNNIVDVGLEISGSGGGAEFSIHNVIIVNISGDSAIGILSDNAGTIVENCSITNVTAEAQMGSGGIGTDFSTAVGIAVTFTNVAAGITISNTTIDGIVNHNVNGSAYGVLTNVRSGSIENCDIKNITCGENQTGVCDDVIAAGIFEVFDPNVGTPNLLVQDNTISYIVSVNSCSGSSAAETCSTACGIKSLFGIPTCSSNNISNITSGDADTTLAVGIAMDMITFIIECNSNILSVIASGNGINSSSACGITLSDVSITGTNSFSGTCNENIISNLTSGDGERSQVVGIAFEELSLEGLEVFFCARNRIFDINNTSSSNAIAIGISCSDTPGSIVFSRNIISNIRAQQETVGILFNNVSRSFISLGTIEHIVATSGLAYGILLESSDSEGSEGSNENFIRDTKISHVTGPQGFGISILDENARKNSLFVNLICDITTKAIDIIAPTDATCVIHRARLLPNGDLNVRGAISNLGALSASYRFEFYINDCNTIPQTPKFIALLDFDATASDPESFDITFTPFSPVEEGQFLTMTATITPETLFNTSEVSNTRRVRVSNAGGVLCNLACSDGSDSECCAPAA